MDNNITLWEKTNYLLPVPYIIATNIYEYDIKQANINVLYNLGIIDTDYYDKLKSMKKIDRQVEIGYLILRYPELDISNRLAKGIANCRKTFMESNGINDGDLLSIKNDAIFIINKKPKVTKFGNVEFVNKNTYSSYIILGNLEVYFRSDMITNQFIMDIKGIGDDKLKYHEEYMCSWIAQMLYLVESGDLENAIKEVQSFYESYMRLELDPGYYRTFDSFSSYPIMANGRMYMVNQCTKNDLSAINIMVNLNIIREIYKYITELYFQRKRN